MTKTLKKNRSAKVPAITSVGLKRGRSDSSSSSSSSSSSTSEQEDQKIDGEGDAVMHMKNLPEQHLTKEYKSSISTKGGGGSVMYTKKTGEISQCKMWSRSFRRPGCAAEPVAEDFEEVGVLMTVPFAL